MVVKCWKYILLFPKAMGGRGIYFSMNGQSLSLKYCWPVCPLSMVLHEEKQAHSSSSVCRDCRVGRHWEKWRNMDRESWVGKVGVPFPPDTTVDDIRLKNAQLVCVGAYLNSQLGDISN